MPLVIRGKEKTKNRPAGGTRRYADCKCQLWDRYELSTVKKTDVGYLLMTTKINICVYCKNMMRAVRYERREVRKTRLSSLVSRLYNRIRVGIRTSTRSALLRLLYFALSIFLRNLWITFEREEIFAGGIVKQQTSGYYSFENFRGDMQKNIAKMIPILTSKKENMTLKNKGA